MKKLAPGRISNSERSVRRVLRLTAETVRLLDPEAMAGVLAGCDTTSNPTESPPVSRTC